MEIKKVSRDWWQLFKRYHYLTHTIPNNSECYIGFIDNDPIAFVAINKFPHPVNKNIVKVGRVVVVPAWQSKGIGMKMVEFIVSNYYQDKDVRFTTSLPIIHNYLYNNDNWAITFQGFPPPIGKTSSVKSEVRKCYLETYQYINEAFDKDKYKLSRQKCPVELRKTKKHIM